MATESAELPTRALVWNAAHDGLEADDVELVKSHMKTLESALRGEAREPSATDLSAKLKDPTTRQMHIRELFQKGAGYL